MGQESYDRTLLTDPVARFDADMAAFRADQAEQSAQRDRQFCRQIAAEKNKISVQVSIGSSIVVLAIIAVVVLAAVAIF